MAKELINVGDVFSIHFSMGKSYDGKVINKNIIDPLKKYEVRFDNLETTLFFSENMLRRAINFKK